MADMEKSIDELIVYMERQKENNKIAINMIYVMILIVVVLLGVAGGYHMGYHAAMNEVTEKIVFTAIGLR
jgi:hypothetical protein